MQIQRAVQELLEKAIALRSSDIFIWPKEDEYHLDFRSHEKIIPYEHVTNDEGNELINYFKYTAQMDIAEHRRPQVGAMTFLWQEQKYYLRLSSLGDYNDQESLVIRIIYQIEESRYFFNEQLTLLEKLARKRGLIVTSGPTGSGKTTTMYEIAKRIGQGKVVMTIEDPVEVQELSFLQSQINQEAGIDYQTLLKAALRHRPDILIIGEIRDEGTARLAINAALSGHLVLATVHAKSTYQTIARLEGLGIKQDELNNCLTAISYQRLLPVKDGVACLLDIAAKNDLKPKMQKDFFHWRKNLKILNEQGQIDEKTMARFQDG